MKKRKKTPKEQETPPVYTKDTNYTVTQREEKTEGVGVMKDKQLQLQDTDASRTLRTEEEHSFIVCLFATGLKKGESRGQTFSVCLFATGLNKGEGRGQTVTPNFFFSFFPKNFLNQTKRLCFFLFLVSED